MTNKILKKDLKSIAMLKMDASRIQKRLQRESPNAAFKIEGKRGGPYYVYQVWYEK